MLVITRKAGEKLCLGDDIVITVLEMEGSAVRLGIEAPTAVPVYRYEIWAAVQEENRAAAETGVDDLPSSSSPAT